MSFVVGSPPTSCCPPSCTCCAHPSMNHSYQRVPLRPYDQHQATNTAALNSSSSATEALLADQGAWVQIRIVNGSDDSVWWKVACQPEQETVGHLRKRLIKGTGSFAPNLYHDGHTLQDSASLKQLGISEYSVLSTGHGASLVYGKKALASIAAARNKGLDVVSDEAKRNNSSKDKSINEGGAAKKRWSTAPPTESLWNSVPAVKSILNSSSKRSSSSGHVTYVDNNIKASHRKHRSSSSASSSSTSSSSSDSDDGGRHQDSHRDRRHHRSRSRERRHSSSRRSGSIDRGAPGPTLIMPVAVCRCHADPMLFPVHLDGLRPEYIREHAAGCSSAPKAHKVSTPAGRSGSSASAAAAARQMGLSSSSPSSKGKVPLRTVSSSPNRSGGGDVMPCNRGTAKRIGDGAAASKAVRFASSSSRQSTTPRSASLSGGEGTRKETVSVGDVLDGILSQAAKKKPIKSIGVMKEESNTLEKTMESRVLKDRIKDLERERDGLRNQIGLLSSRAPDRTGLRTPSFPLDNAVATFDPLCGDRPPPTTQQTLSATTLGSMRPGGLSCVCASHHYAPASNAAMAQNYQQTMPHYLVAEAPYGAYPYKAADDWITSMPEECRPLLASTIQRTIAAPGLLKGSAPLFPHAPATAAVASGSAAAPHARAAVPYAQQYYVTQTAGAPSTLPRPL